MIYYDRTDIFGEIDINKTNEWKERDICHYYYLLNKGFKFQPNVCNGYHDLLMLSTNLSYITILNINSAGYCSTISRIRNSEAINLLRNIDLPEKTGTL